MQRARAPTCPRREPAGCPGRTRRVSPVSPDPVRETALHPVTTDSSSARSPSSPWRHLARVADPRAKLIDQFSQFPYDGASASYHRAEHALNAWKGQAGGTFLTLGGDTVTLRQ
jgi:hypothetical protein